MNELSKLQLMLQQEQLARKKAESILQEKAMELSKLNEELESKFNERTKELHISEEKYRGIIENMELGLLEVDNEHTILRAYSWFCDMTGYSKEELVGQNAVDFLIADSGALERVDSELKKRKRGQAGVYELQIKHKNGNKIWVLVSGSPMLDLKGNVIGSIGIHYDITDRKQLEMDLILAKKMAEAAQEAEKQFLAKMSHEIRTPLNAIIGMSYLLTGTSPTEEQKEYLSVLQSSSEILKLLISDILDFSKIQAGEITIKISEFDVIHLIENLHKTARLRLQGRPVVVQSHIDKRIVNKLLGDELLLNQILINLITNAIKFTESGTIDIQVKLLNADEKYYHLEFQVADTGIGIPADKLTMVFEDFKQVDNDLQILHSGTGLGLSITKQLVELHGGTIKVESTPNVRTLFYFDIKYEKAGEITERGLSENLVDTDLVFKDVNLLVAEDNVMNQKYIAALLKKWGIQFEFANDGEEAIEKAFLKKYDLIFMDISMPKKNGYEATSGIRSEKNPNQNTPIIALSAFAFVHKKEEALEIGMTDFLGKPFDPKSLIGILHQYLKGSNKTNINITPTEEDLSPELLDAKHLALLYDDDQEAIQEMFSLFLSDTIPEFKEIEKFLQQQDYACMGRAVHELKPNFEMVGFLQGRSLMQTLENLCAEGKEEEVIAQYYQKITRMLEEVTPVLEREILRMQH